MIKKIIVQFFPSAATFWGNLKVMLRYRSFSPKAIPLPYSSSRLFVNWNEPRGRALLTGNAMGQPNIKSFWKCAVEEFSPEVIVDCGLNYGEILFWCNYPNAKHIFGIEADQSLFPYLDKSLQTHPDKEKINLICALVSDTTDEEQTFYIDPSWSGRSSALHSEKISGTNLTSAIVKTVTIDHILHGITDGKKLLFKIDVEGFEPFVLKGMGKTFAAAENYMGIIEFNPAFINKTAGDADTYLQLLQNQHDVYWLTKTLPIDQMHSLQGLAMPINDNLPEGDLIIAKKGSLLFKK